MRYRDISITRKIREISPYYGDISITEMCQLDRKSRSRQIYPENRKMQLYGLPLDRILTTREYMPPHDFLWRFSLSLSLSLFYRDIFYLSSISITQIPPKAVFPGKTEYDSTYLNDASTYFAADEAPHCCKGLSLHEGAVP